MAVTSEALNTMSDIQGILGKIIEAKLDYREPLQGEVRDFVRTEVGEQEYENSFRIGKECFVLMTDDDVLAFDYALLECKIRSFWDLYKAKHNFLSFVFPEHFPDIRSHGFLQIDDSGYLIPYTVRAKVNEEEIHSFDRYVGKKKFFMNMLKFSKECGVPFGIDSYTPNFVYGSRSESDENTLYYVDRIDNLERAWDIDITKLHQYYMEKFPEYTKENLLHLTKLVSDVDRAWRTYCNLPT